MRAKLGLAGLALLAFGVGAARAEPLKIRGAWVAPLANWASVWVQKKDLAVHFGQSYEFEAVHYAGTPPMITAIANNELEIGNLAYLHHADRDRECRDGRYPRHQRRLPGRRPRL